MTTKASHPHPLQSPAWIVTAPIAVEQSIDIAAPPERVWSLIADNEGWPRWFRGISKVEARGAPSGVGGGRRLTVGKVVLEETFTAWDAPSHWALAVVASSVPLIAAAGGEVLIKPSGAGCRVTYRQGMQARRGAHWLMTFLNRGAPQRLERALGELRRLAEAA
jgi:hypothetical protein